MIRTSRQNRKHVTKLVLRRETVRTLGDSELAEVIGGNVAGCTADTQQVSSCTGINLGDAKVPHK